MTFNYKDLKPGDVCIMRNGDEATFVGVNPYDSEQPYVFAMVSRIQNHSEDGGFYGFSTDPRDIISKKPEKITRWVNVYNPEEKCYLYDKRSDADRYAISYGRPRTACIQIIYEVGEGV